MKPHPLRHVTHAVLLLMMLATTWLVIRTETLIPGAARLSCTLPKNPTWQT